MRRFVSTSTLTGAGDNLGHERSVSRSDARPDEEGVAKREADMSRVSADSR